jgi:hypothetical protein
LAQPPFAPNRGFSICARITARRDKWNPPRPTIGYRVTGLNVKADVPELPGLSDATSVD